MTRPRFYNVGVTFASLVPKTEMVERTLDIFAPDWLRYAPNSWLIWTDKTPQQLTEALKPLLQQDQFLILPIDSSYQIQGWSSQFVWDWINRSRGSGWTPPTPTPAPNFWSDQAKQNALREALSRTLPGQINKPKDS